jgi:ABC-2 type transport system permease protein
MKKLAYLYDKKSKFMFNIDLKKLRLIIRREYLTRVTNKTFIWATILVPLGFAVLTIFTGVLAAYDGSDTLTINVIDEANVLDKSLESTQKFNFIYTETDVQKAIETCKANKNLYDGVLLIPKLTSDTATKIDLTYFSNEKLGVESTIAIQQSVAARLREYKMQALNIDKVQLEKLRTNVKIESRTIRDNKSNGNEMTGAIATMIGTIMGIIMYMSVFLYGSLVMRSVMEEKTNRIVEVIISSVKPTELMLGKIIGAGAVGLTQLAIWMVIMPIILVAVQFFFGLDLQQTNPHLSQINTTDLPFSPSVIVQEIQSQNWLLIIPLFAFYFLGGYLLYASLFAAVGSAIGDDYGEAQSLVLPISIPVILAFSIMMTAVRSPKSTLAVWGSIFPLFSPIVMPARLPFNPPFWEIALSVVLLCITAAAFVWISGRIYRVGILLYGKKASVSEMVKWIFRNE